MLNCGEGWLRTPQASFSTCPGIFSDVPRHLFRRAQASFPTCPGIHFEAPRSPSRVCKHRSSLLSTLKINARAGWGWRLDVKRGVSWVRRVCRARQRRGQACCPFDGRRPPLSGAFAEGRPTLRSWPASPVAESCGRPTRSAPGPDSAGPGARTGPGARSGTPSLGWPGRPPRHAAGTKCCRGGGGAPGRTSTKKTRRI